MKSRNSARTLPRRILFVPRSLPDLIVGGGDESSVLAKSIPEQLHIINAFITAVSVLTDEIVMLSE